MRTCCSAGAPQPGLGQGSAAQEGADAHGAGSSVGRSRAEAEGVAGSVRESRGVYAQRGQASSQGWCFPHFFHLCCPSLHTPGLGRLGLSSPQSCQGQQPLSLERGAQPCRLLTDPEVQVIQTFTWRWFDVPTAYYGTGLVQLLVPRPVWKNTTSGLSLPHSAPAEAADSWSQQHFGVAGRAPCSPRTPQAGAGHPARQSCSSPSISDTARGSGGMPGR